MKRSVWDYLFYASLLILLIWLILKVTGVIRTPVWLEYGVPIATVIMTFFTFYQGLLDKIFSMQLQINVLAVNDARIEERLKHLDKDFEELKKAVI